MIQHDIWQISFLFLISDFLLFFPLRAPVWAQAFEGTAIILNYHLGNLQYFSSLHAGC